jgi:glycosyltransferase involved in cell wall biosynthesis
MSRRPRACVVQVPPFDPDRMLGGAEVIAVHLVRALTAIADVTVLHGTPDPAPPHPPGGSGFPAQVLAAFPLDEHVRERGHIRPCLTEPARRVLTEADVLIIVERTLDLDHPFGASRIALLGGVGYPHTLDVLRHRAWDRLVVPSPFVARQVAEHAPQAQGVAVVENGLDPALFAPPCIPVPASPEVRLLVASRPGWDKGFRRALGLARALESAGTPVTLVCFAQPDGFGPPDFASELRSEAAVHGVRLRVLPWRAHTEMPEAYHRADLTLCLGDAPEGFGLTAAESIACCTPVMACPAGFLGEMLPPDHGLYLVSPDADPADLVPAALAALAHGAEHCRSRGRPYIATRYSLTRMATTFAHLVGELAGAG